MIEDHCDRAGAWRDGKEEAYGEVLAVLKPIVAKANAVPLGLGCSHCENMNNINRTAEVLGKLAALVRDLGEKSR